MGAKTALLAFADTDIPAALAAAPRSERGAAEALARRSHFGRPVEFRHEDDLRSCIHPYDDTVYAASLPGVDLLCDTRVALGFPTDLPDHLLDLGAGRRTVLHAMHSVVDWAAFAVWENGELVRAMSVSSDSGVIDEFGDPLPFERHFWVDELPVDHEDYVLPFHPLDLGEAALVALFGFAIEGLVADDPVNPSAITLHGFGPMA